MKILFSTFRPKTHILYVFLVFVCSFSFIQWISVYAFHPTTGAESEHDNNFYSKARKWEEEQGAKYLEDWMKGFSKKLDKAIKTHPQLYKFFEEWYCDGCDSVVSEELDQALTEELARIPPLTKNDSYEYTTLVRSHLDKRIKNVSTKDAQALNTLVNIMIDSITGQIKEQMSAFRDISMMWLYYDGNTDNSPEYDLMAQIRDMEKIAFNDPPELGPYSNTYLTDIAGLISGKTSPSGTWWSQGDIQGEVLAALGMSSPGPEKSVAAVCNGPTCGGPVKDSVNIAALKNNAFNPVQHTWRNTDQNNYETWLDWLIKYGANRNLSCKTQTWFFFQSLFDKNASLKELFSMAVYPVQEVPELLKWFMDRETRTAESEDQQALDSIDRALRARWVNSKRKEEFLIAGMWRAFYDASRSHANKNVPLSTTNDAVERWQAEYQKYLLSQGKWVDGSFRNKHDVESMEHLNVFFEEMASRARSENDSAKTLNTIFDYVLSKDNCQPA